MPVGLILGFAVFALEIAGLGWLLHWCLAGSDNWMAVAAVALVALPITVFAVGSVIVADRSDDGMEEYLVRHRHDEGPSHGVSSVNAFSASNRMPHTEAASAVAESGSIAMPAAAR